MPATTIPRQCSTPVPDDAWLNSLNTEQRTAVTHGDCVHGVVDAPPTLVVAGAGTGKTATLTHRVAWLILNGVSPDRIALLTFSRRAAGEMVRRTGEILMHQAAATSGATGTAPLPNATLQLPWAGTFHSVAARLLRQHAVPLGLNPAFTIMDRADAVDLIGWLRDRHGLSQHKKRFPGASTCLNIYSDKVNCDEPLADVLSDRYPWCNEFEPALRELFGAYVDRKLSDAVLDYDDLLLWWLHGMQVPVFRDAVARRFDHILIDEFQDSNQLQMALIQQLSPLGRGVFAVGDDAQSIYSFRAARVELMYSFDTHFQSESSRQTLCQNYRSTQAVLDCANALMAGSNGPWKKNLVAASQQPGVLPRLAIVGDDAAQAEYVIAQVLLEREAGIALKEQAVLFRSAHHSDLLEVFLARCNIPFVKHGGLRFIEAAHVRDYLALLRWSQNIRHHLAGFRALQMLPGVGPAIARTILDELASGSSGGLATNPGDSVAQSVSGAANPFCLLSKCKVPQPAQPAWPGLCALMTTLSEPGIRWGEKLSAINHYIEPLIEQRYDASTGRLADLQVLQSLAARSGSAEQFLSDMALDPPNATGAWSDDAQLDEDYLILSTVHSAKGQEWENVFVLNVADGNFPNEYATGNQAAVEEERRLLYVAMTRAKQNLHLVEPQRYYVTHQPRHGAAHVYGVRSRFLDTQVLRTLDETAVANQWGANQWGADRADAASRQDTVNQSAPGQVQVPETDAPLGPVAATLRELF